MIEMLGVLAVVGILSAGGIMGYSVAMENYKVNKLFKDIDNTVGQITNLLAKNGLKSYISANQAHNLGLIPEDYYKTSHIANEGTYKGMEVFTPPFGKYMRWIVYGSSSPLTLYTTLRFNQGQYTLHPPISILYVTITNVPKSICLKILTRDWKNLSPVMTIVFVSNRVTINKPISLPDAEIVCKVNSTNATDGIIMGINSYVSGRLERTD